MRTLLLVALFLVSASAQVSVTTPNGKALWSPDTAPTSGQILKYNSGSSKIEWGSSINLSSLTVDDDAYAAGWNGSTNVPTKNAVWDQMELKISSTALDTIAELNAQIGDADVATVGGNIGAATATTPAENDNDTSVATTAYVQTEIAGLAGTPAGSDTQVQFNDGGSFGGDSGLTFNKTSNALTVAGALSASSFTGTGATADSRVDVPDDDGSHYFGIQAANTTTTSVNLVGPAAPFSGIPKFTASGTNFTMSAAVSGTDYQSAFTTGLGITNASGVLSNNIVAGSNVTITSGSDGQLTIAASGGSESKDVQLSDQSINSSTTLVDSELQIAISANTKYSFEAVLSINQANGTADPKVAITCPSSPTTIRYAVSASTAVGANSAATASGTGLTANTSGRAIWRLVGFIDNGANAGNLTVQFAQNASDAGATTLEAGSFFIVKPL